MLTALIEYMGKTTGTLNRGAKSVSLALPSNAHVGDTIITIITGKSLYRSPRLTFPTNFQILSPKSASFRLSSKAGVWIGCYTVNNVNASFTYKLADDVAADLTVTQLVYRGVDTSGLSAITLSSFSDTDFSFDAPGVPISGEKSVVISGLVTEREPELSFSIPVGHRVLYSAESGVLLTDYVNYRTSKSTPVQIRLNKVQNAMTFALAVPAKIFQSTQVLRVKNPNEYLVAFMLSDATHAYLYPGEYRDLPVTSFSEDIRRQISQGMLIVTNLSTGALVS